jgi:DNA-binding NarL/FixJ family response regulator
VDGQVSTAALDARSAPRLASVVLCSGARLYRDSLAATLASVPEVVLVGSFASAADAASRLPDLRPDIVLVEVSMPDAASAFASIVEAAPGARLVAILGSNEAQLVVECAVAGVSGIVAGDASLDDLMTVILSAQRGGFSCSPSIAPLLRLHVALPSSPRGGQAAEGARLTRREIEIVDLIDQGLSNKQIAQALSIEVSTTKNHVHHILQKLGVERRTAAIAAVRRREPA